MLTAALAVLIALQPAEALSDAEDAVPATEESATEEGTEAEAIGKIAGCGIAPGLFRAENDEMVGGWVIVVTVPAAKLAAPAYVCLARAEMEKGARISLDDPEATQLFWQAHEEASREGARERMRDLGLLAKLPRYDPAQQSLAQYARALETLCGVAPGKGFTVAGPESLTLPDAMALGAEPPSPCLLDAAGASNLHEHGVTVSLDAPAAE